jgi:hypothetical protein
MQLSDVNTRNNPERLQAMLAWRRVLHHDSSPTSSTLTNPVRTA